MAMAKGISGAAGMRKDELIKKLVGLAKSKPAAKPAPAKQTSVKKTAPKPVAALKPKARGAKPAPVPMASKRASKPAMVASVAKSTPVSKSTSVSKRTPAATLPKRIEKPAASSAKALKSKPDRPVDGASQNHRSGLAKKSPSITTPGGDDATAKATAKKISQPKAVAAPIKLERKARPTNPVVAGKIRSVQQQRASAKDLAFFRDQLSTSEEPKKDRLVLFVRDPYWLQAYWELTSTGVQRAKAALAEDWHVAVPVLRLLVNPEDGVTGASEQVAREIKIHGGVNNWYIDVTDPPQTFRAVIGYLAPGNRFHSIAYSNVVHTPTPGTSDHVDHNWTDLIDNGDRVFSLSGGFGEGSSIALREVFEEKLSRPMTRSALSRYGTSDIPGKPSGGDFVVDAELLIFGKTHRSSEVTISGEPVKLRDDGSFTVRVGLPDKRQVFPVSSTSFDGTFTYTTVLAIERNTKVMEPLSSEPGEDF